MAAVNAYYIFFSIPKALNIRLKLKIYLKMLEFQLFCIRIINRICQFRDVSYKNIFCVKLISILRSKYIQ